MGDHLLALEPAAQIWPAARAEQLADRVRRCLRIADSRTAHQDLRFAQ